jgi:preprotein translocase subunit SecG
MNWLHTVILILHVLFAAAIVGLVLLQRGKGADAGAGFGAGASGTVFGARGSASFLSRTTATLAALFIGTNLTLAYMGSHVRSEAPSSVIDRLQQNQEPNSSSVMPALPEEAPAAAQPERQKPAEAPGATPEAPKQ